MVWIRPTDMTMGGHVVDVEIRKKRRPKQKGDVKKDLLIMETIFQQKMIPDMTCGSCMMIDF